ncbi:MAG TPA: hypothetical protein VGD78_08925 [Chthoniobacterales bacterium]
MSTIQTTVPKNDFPVADGKFNLNQYWSELEDRVRRQPGQSLAVALVLGLLLQNLPIRALLGLVVHLISVLIRPAILVLAVANVYRLLSERQKTAPLLVTPDSGSAAP